MRMAQISVSLLVGAVLVAGCGSADPARPAPEEPAPRGLVSQLAAGDAGEVGEAVNAFGFDLLGEVTDGGENAITSPVSVATLLAMVLAGAGGETATAMAEALHLPDARDVRVGALQETLAATDDVTLSTGNALWAAEDVPFETDYLDFVKETFDATVANADLAAPATADAIDAWVAEHTEGLIEEIAEDLGLPDPEIALVLLNAVYFLGEWTTQFDPDETVEAPFTLADGSQAEVPLMHLREQEWAYAQREGYQLLRLPYGEEGRYGMEVLLPDPEIGLSGLVGQLDAEEWRAAVDSLADRTVDELALPRFTLDWGGNLNEPLQRLGMGPAFDVLAADFTPMSPADLFLETVVHKTFLRVDEAGTEAAAVTGGAVGITSAQPPLVFRVDRPFAFTVSDTETGTILFLGAVADPRS